jgi:acetoacetyl-CoA synthetase
VITDGPIWTPSPERAAGTSMAAFLDFVREQRGLDLPDYHALWRWSVDRIEDFWCSIWDFFEIIADTRGERVLVDGDDQQKAAFFPDARLNVTENLLRRRDDGLAILFRNERGDERRLSWAALTAEVARLAEALLADGIEPGDRVAAYMPNVPETVIAALAAGAIGATFSSCAPDFGTRGVLDRFGQIEPVVLIAADGYHYNGKTHQVTDRVAEIQAGLPTLRRTVFVSYVNAEPGLDALPGAVAWTDYLAPHRPDAVPYTRLPFNHPLFILFSSGTTGAPKCMVHRAGGCLLQGLKEPGLHLDARPDDRVQFFTSTTWVVWNLHLAFLGSGSAILLYDGSPFYPGPDALFDYMERGKATHFGASAKFIDAIKAAGIAPRRDRDLSALRVMLTSGSALLPECFDYVYEKVKGDLQLSSISGGTDIMCGFVTGNPIGPVWRGEIQAPALGMAVDVFDDAGHPLPPGHKGELVCTKPHPSLPLEFLNDPDGSRYREAYFEHFPGVWRHGDLMEWTEHGGCIIYGRSDATLNPGGIRIGTAEIYRPVEQLDEVVEALAVGQDWPPDSRIVLFVVLKEGLTLDDALRDRIKAAIRASATPRHVPARILQVPDIPRTKTGKIVELAVRDVVHGRPVRNVDALANPDALAFFEGREELAE